jgi:hypothetical protein
MIDKIKWQIENVWYKIWIPYNKWRSQQIKRLYIRRFYDPYGNWFLNSSDYSDLYTLVYNELRKKLDDTDFREIKLTEEQLGDLLDKVEYGMKI